MLIQYLMNDHMGGMVGGLGSPGRLTMTLGACSLLGRGPVGGTSAGWLSLLPITPTGMLPGLLIDVAFPGLFSYFSDFLMPVEAMLSAVKLTIFSPLTMTRPRVRLICLATPVFLLFVTRYSSVSANTMFMCLSKARKVPTIILPSWMVSLTRKSIHCRNLERCVAIINDFYNRWDNTKWIEIIQS